MRNVELILNGRRAVVSFLSRYRDKNDFEIYQGGKTGRVSKRDNGEVISQSENFSQSDAAIAILAYEVADAKALIEWRKNLARLEG